MDSSSPLARVDDPHEADAGRQVLPDLVQDLAGPVLGREDLNREIRGKLAEALGSDPARQPPLPVRQLRQADSHSAMPSPVKCHDPPSTPIGFVTIMQSAA